MLFICFGLLPKFPRFPCGLGLYLKQQTSFTCNRLLPTSCIRRLKFFKGSSMRYLSATLSREDVSQDSSIDSPTLAQQTRCAPKHPQSPLAPQPQKQMLLQGPKHSMTNAGCIQLRRLSSLAGTALLSSTLAVRCMMNMLCSRLMMIKARAAGSQLGHPLTPLATSKSTCATRRELDSLLIYTNFL